MIVIGIILSSVCLSVCRSAISHQQLSFWFWELLCMYYFIYLELSTNVVLLCMFLQ